MKKLTVLIIGATMMAACGGSSAESSDTTIVAVTVGTTIAAALPESVSPTVAETESGAPDETEAESVAESAVDVGEGDAAALLGSSDPMAQVAATLGITDPADMKCITDKVAANGGPGTPDATGIDPALIKAVMACQPPSLVELASQQISVRLPNLSGEQATCAAKATLTVLSGSEKVDFSALTAGPSAIPEGLRAQLNKPIRACGLTDADLKAYLGG
jgi:hypothetical protein